MTQVDLAGRWKHGWVPLGPIAIREKAKGNPKTIALYKKRYKAAASKEINRRKTAKAKSQSARSKESTLDRVRADIAKNRREAQAVIPKPQEGEKVGRDGYSPSQRKYIRENFDRLVKDGKIQYMKPVSRKMPNGMTQKTLEPSSEPTDQVRMPGGGIVETSKFKQGKPPTSKQGPHASTSMEDLLDKARTLAPGSRRNAVDAELRRRGVSPNTVRQGAAAKRAKVGPSDNEKITNAAKMYGTNSPQYREAIRRFGKKTGRTGHTVNTGEAWTEYELPNGKKKKLFDVDIKKPGEKHTTRRPASSNASADDVREYVNSKSTKELEEMLQRNLSARVKAAAQRVLAERKRRTP